MQVIIETANVGIGETAPGAKLSVSGGLAVGSSYDTTGVSDGQVIISGNVGIGTTNPAQKLHVEGQCVTGDTLLPVLRKLEARRKRFNLHS